MNREDIVLWIGVALSICYVLFSMIGSTRERLWKDENQES